MAEQGAIEAATLTGSLTTGFATPGSDIDLFVYVRDETALDRLERSWQRDTPMRGASS